jgi:hypothetical protein
MLRVADAICFRERTAQLFSHILGELQLVLPRDVVALVFPDASQNKLTIELWNGSRCLRSPLRAAMHCSMTASGWRGQTTLHIDDLAIKNLTRNEQTETKLRSLGEFQMWCDTHTQRISNKNPS